MLLSIILTFKIRISNLSLLNVWYTGDLGHTGEYIWYVNSLSLCVKPQCTHQLPCLQLAVFVCTCVYRWRWFFLEVCLEVHIYSRVCVSGVS